MEKVKQLSMDPIHIIGAGAIGCLLTSSLVIHGSKRVTLLTRHPLETTIGPISSSLHIHKEHEKTGNEYTRLPIYLDSTKRHVDRPDISYMICTTKAYQTLQALQETRHRWNHTPRCLLLQNGMGVLEELNDCLEKPPLWVLGVTSMAGTRIAPFHVRLTGTGTTYLHNVNWPDSEYQELLIYLNKSLPDWSIEDVPLAELFRRRQLMKLVVNACLNPLGTLFECPNGQLLEHRSSIEPLLKLLIDEALMVFGHQKVLPSFEEIEAYLWHIITHTYKNENSMLQDIKMHRPTEIDYLNGYIVKEARKLGITCPNHSLLIHLIHAKEQLYGLERL